MRQTILLFSFLAMPTIASAADVAPSAVTLLASTTGDWKGELQYRDYQANTWQGLPVTVKIVAQPDAVTTIRTAQYDDGPQTGIVTITTATLVDPAASTASYAIFRKNRATDVGLAKITDVKQGADAVHWTIVSEEMRKDGNSMAAVRETTVRDGDVMTTVKDVNPVDDGKDVWLPRNRTVLRRIGA